MFWGPFKISRIFRTFCVIWESFEEPSPEDVVYLLCIFLTFRGQFEDQLRTWGLRGPWVPFVHFLDLLWILWTYWGLFVELMTWFFQNIEEPFRNFWWLLVNLLRTVFRKFWGLCEDHLMTIWGTFDYHRILRTLINFCGIWGRLEYLLWTSVDFEGFDDLLRKLRTSWGSAENLRTARTLGIFCAFSWHFWGFCGPLEDTLKNWWPEDRKRLKNFSGPFQEFLWTFFRTVFRNSWGLCEDHLMTIWGTFDDHRTFEDVDNFLRTLRSFWIPFADLWGLRGVWGPTGDFKDVDLLKFLRTLRTIWVSFEDLSRFRGFLEPFE